jgi:UDP-N-acetylmuramate--alanine ligase
MNSRLLKYKFVYFIGIGGIGMSALARFFKRMGKDVEGYDKVPSSITDALQSINVGCYFDENKKRLSEKLKRFSKDEVLIIHTPAVPKTHEEYVWLKENNFLIRKRAEVLGEISRSFRTIAIAGTHGKTTTTTFITHLLKTAGLQVVSFMGGISGNYKTNLLLPDNFSDTSETWMVAEADEYDRSFLHLDPEIGIITSTDPDHLDIYHDEKFFKESFLQFAALCKRFIIVNKHVENEFLSVENRITYSINLNSTCCVRSLNVSNASSLFVPEVEKQLMHEMQLNVPGMHNLENVLAGILLGKKIGLSEEVIADAVKTFKGVERRFDIRVRHPQMVYIDDYAHHPTEIQATLNAVKNYFPGKKLRVIFQPHLYSRTRDFMDGFAESLSLADEVWLMDIYPAREEPIKGITSDVLLEKIKIKNKKLVNREYAWEHCMDGEPEIIMTMGAGDIDRLVPLIENKIKKYLNIDS